MLLIELHSFLGEYRASWESRIFYLLFPEGFQIDDVELHLTPKNTDK